MKYNGFEINMYNNNLYNNNLCMTSTRHNVGANKK